MAVLTAQAIAQLSPPAGAKVIPLPDLKRGSWWVYKDKDGEKKWELKKVEGGKFFVQVEGEGRERIYTNEWNWVEGPGTAGWVTYSPHFYDYSFPLWQGKKWTGQYTGGGFPRRMWGEAKQWDTVKVPAGTFEALKVEVTRERSASTGRLMQIKSTCWYADEVRDVIKCDDTELLRYELK